MDSGVVVVPEENYDKIIVIMALEHYIKIKVLFES